MKARNRAKATGRRQSGTFILIPHAVVDCANWKRASPTAICLLMELARQFNGYNNGNLCASRTLLRPRGWTSPEVITWAIRELLHYGFIIRTKWGGLHMGPNLYALTWIPIDDCKGRHHRAATKVATGDWKEEKPAFVRPEKNRKRNTPSVLGAVRQTYHTH